MNTTTPIQSFLRLLWTVSGCSVLLLVISGALIGWSWRVHAEVAVHTERSYQVLITAREIGLTLVQAEKQLFGPPKMHLIIPGEEMAMPARARLDARLAELEAMTRTSPAQSGRAAQLRQQIGEHLEQIAALPKVPPAAFPGDPPVHVLEVLAGEHRINEMLDAIERAQMQEVIEDQAALERAKTRQFAIAVSLLGAEMILIGTILYLGRRIIALRSFITVCAWSKQIKVHGTWLTLEQYLHDELNAQTTHGISPEMARKMVREINLAREIPKVD